jgi:hypothetical protein
MIRFSAGTITGFFPFATASRPALGLTQPPNQWVQRSLTPGKKLPGREADHLSRRLRKSHVIHPLTKYVFMAWCLVKYKGNFIFTFTLSVWGIRHEAELS